jgi:NAD+ synthase (glutamine-hydrolysing)
MSSPAVFDSPYSHGFARVALCIPRVRVADPLHNTDRTIELARDADRAGAILAVFPELGLSAYSNDDLFHQDALLGAVEESVARVVEASRSLRSILLVGAPLRREAKLFNTAVMVHRGRVLGVVPKTYLPNYREFYEKRQFAPASAALGREVQVAGQVAPFGNDILVEALDHDGFVLHAEICEDVWAPVPPSSWAALGGATVLANLSASNATVAKADYRRKLCAGQSARFVAAYVYAGAGPGESTTDLAWDGHGLIYENGNRLAESERFAEHEQLVLADIDLDRLVQERMRMTSFADSVIEHGARLRTLRRVPVTVGVPEGPLALKRHVPRFPYVPSDPTRQDERCA